jgi:hypothetical protein
MVTFKYVMFSEPYGYTLYLKQVMENLLYFRINFFENTNSTESQMFWNLIFLASQQNFRKVQYVKNWIIHKNNILQYYFS